MRFEGRHEGVTYAITLRPKADDRELLRELEVEVYRKYPSGERRGCTWKIIFFDRSIRVERHEYDGLSWHKVEVSVKASWIEEWYLKDIERTIRDLGVDKAVKHILDHLRIMLGHPLSIPLRL
jgi:hypothetical protein